jgi:hypothetical protein
MRKRSLALRWRILRLRWANTGEIEMLERTDRVWGYKRNLRVFISRIEKMCACRLSNADE